MPFQGKVVNANGTNVADGNYSFTFKLYSVSSGGTSLWGETQTTVAVASGVFQVNLGITCSLFTTQTCSTFSNTAIDFNATPNLYLGVTFNGDAAGEMSPRMQLGSVSYAFNADKVGGLGAAQFVQLSVAQQTGSINVSGGITSASTLAVTGAATFNTTLTVQTTSNSPTAFQVQNIGNNQIFTVDTAASQVILGKLGAAGLNGKLVFNSTNAGNFATSFTTSAAQGANIDYTLPTAIVTNGLLTTGAGGALSWSTSGANLTSLNPTNLTVGSGAVTLQSFAGSALNITGGGAASTWSAGAGTLTLTSANFNVSSLGAITAATGTNTINGLVINSGSLTNVGANITALAGLTIATATTSNLVFDTGTTGSILIGGDTVNAKIISIGPTAANASTTILNLGVNTAGTQNVNIGSAGFGNAAAGTFISIQGGTTANTAVTLGTNGAGGITIDTGTTGSIFIGNGANAKAVTLGSTNTTSATNIQGGTTGSINLGSVGASALASTTNIANTTSGTGIQVVAIGSNANAANTIDIDGGTGPIGIEIGDTATAHGIKIGAGAAAAGAAQTIAVGSGTTTTASLVTLQGGNLTTTNANSGIVIGGGFSTADPNLVGLTLDSSNAYVEPAATCSNTANSGTIYYNSSSNSIRACVRDGINAAGNWEDLPSTVGLGAILFGIVPDSGLSANQGDWAAIGGATVGPCKVSWASATTVNVAPCNAYSGGRKVVVSSATTVTIGTGLANGWNHICFNTTGALITPTVIQATEIAGLPTFSTNNPILCLADVQMINATGNSIAKIYDVRTFTTSTKEFVTNQTALAGLGQTVSTMAATNSVTQVPTTTNTSILRGVVVASSGVTSATAVNAIITTRGPQWVKFAAAAGTLNAFTQPITGGVAGYMNSSATIGTIGYGNLGLQLRLSDNTTCTTTANCQMSVPTDINLR